MSQRHEVKVEQELHGLLDKAMDSADHELSPVFTTSCST